jgi:hypothetical protein
MSAIVVDMRWAVLYWIRRVDGDGWYGEVETADFDEQLTCCADEGEQVALCKRWIGVLKEA